MKNHRWALIIFLVVTSISLCHGQAMSVSEQESNVTKVSSLAGDTFSFPQSIILEKTATGTSLQFELLFKVNKACKPFVILFNYKDERGTSLLCRRLVNHSIEDIERFIAVFDRQNTLRLGSCQLQKGDLAIITHPYGEYNWRHNRLAQIECTAYLKGADGTVEPVLWNIEVTQYTPHIELAIPFKGIWWHLEGHDTFSHHRRIFYKQNTNYFGCDFMKTAKHDAICSGSGTRNEDYYSYKQPIFAAGDGTVVTIIDGVDDNPVGGRAPGFNPADPDSAGGNTVVIKHSPSLFTHYGHLKKRTIQVKMGSTVKSGEIIGLCGNSGNSDAPHLHFHVSDSPSLNPLKGHGLPPVFSSYRLRTGASWLTVISSSVLAGEFISP